MLLCAQFVHIQTVLAGIERQRQSHYRVPLTILFNDHHLAILETCFRARLSRWAEFDDGDAAWRRQMARQFGCTRRLDCADR